MKAEMKERPLVLVVILGLVCTIAGLALGLVYLATKDTIEAEVQNARREALLKVHPNASPEGFKLVETELEAHGKPFTYYEVYDRPLDDEAGKLIGYACEGRAGGYSSTIVVTVGLDADATTITGIKITSQQETPGLGANCEKIGSKTYIWNIFSPGDKEAGPPEPWFQAQFRDRALKGLKREGKSFRDIRALSGATITTNAVVRAALDAVENFRRASGLGDADAVSGATNNEDEQR